MLNGLRADAASGELLPRARAGRRGELLAEVFRRHFVHFQQCFAQTRVAPRGFVFTAVASLGQGDAKLLREHLDGVLEAHLLVKLQELEHIAAHSTAEAMEKSLVGIDVERRRLLRVERTEAFVSRARAFQRDVLLHYLHDVRLQLQIVNELLRKQTQSLSSTTVTPPPPCSGGAVANRATSGCCCRNPLNARFSWPVP